MCDPSLTDTGGRSSEFPEEAEPWRSNLFWQLVQLCPLLRLLLHLLLMVLVLYLLPVMVVLYLLLVMVVLYPLLVMVLSVLQMTRRRWLSKRLHPVLRKLLQNWSLSFDSTARTLTQSLQKARPPLYQDFLHWAAAEASPNKRGMRRRGRARRKGRKLLAARVDLFHLALVIVSSAAFWVSLSWLALLQMLTRCRFTTHLTLLCPPISVIPSGSKTFYNGLLTTVACLGKRGNSHGWIYTSACIFTLLLRSTLLTIFDAWPHVVWVVTPLYLLAFAAGLADSLGREGQWRASGLPLLLFRGIGTWLMPGSSTKIGCHLRCAAVWLYRTLLGLYLEWILRTRLCHTILMHCVTCHARCHLESRGITPRSMGDLGISSAHLLGVVAKGFTRIGCQNPLQMWEKHLGKEIKSFIFPSADVHSYSEAREKWHLTFCKRSSMLQWLLHMEEHCFYLFLIKVMASRSILSRGSLALQDREKRIWRCQQSVRTTVMTTLNCLMCVRSWSIAKLWSLYACPWRRTLLSLLHLTGTHRHLMTHGRGRSTSSLVEEGTSFFTHAFAVHLPASPAQWCLVCLFLTLGPCIDASYLCSSLS